MEQYGRYIKAGSRQKGAKFKQELSVEEDTEEDSNGSKRQLKRLKKNNDDDKEQLKLSFSLCTETVVEPPVEESPQPEEDSFPQKLLRLKERYRKHKQLINSNIK